MNRTDTGLLAIAASCATTLVALMPVSRYLSKIGGDVFYTAKRVFVHQSLTSLALGLALVACALLLNARRPIASLMLLIAAPVVTLLAGLELGDWW